MQICRKELIQKKLGRNKISFVKNVKKLLNPFQILKSTRKPTKKGKVAKVTRDRERGEA